MKVVSAWVGLQCCTTVGRNANSVLLYSVHDRTTVVFKGSYISVISHGGIDSTVVTTGGPGCLVGGGRPLIRAGSMPVVTWPHLSAREQLDARFLGKLLFIQQMPSSLDLGIKQSAPLTTPSAPLTVITLYHFVWTSLSLDSTQPRCWQSRLKFAVTEF